MLASLGRNTLLEEAPLIVMQIACLDVSADTHLQKAHDALDEEALAIAEANVRKAEIAFQATKHIYDRLVIQRNGWSVQREFHEQEGFDALKKSKLAQDILAISNRLLTEESPNTQVRSSLEQSSLEQSSYRKTHNNSCPPPSLSVEDRYES